MNLVTSVFPFVRWFKGYSLSGFRADFISGLTVALVLVPQSMAYAQLAGLPAYYGLYAAFLPPMVAALFGSSRQLATGPVAVVSLMTATALEPLATAGSESFIAYAILLALMVGLFQLALGVLRLGLVVNFLSHPVVIGFTNAAALIIASSQLSKLFGVQVDKAEHHYQTVINVIKAAMSYTHWPTVLLAVLAFATMILLRRIHHRIPNVLVAVVIATVVSWTMGFERDHEAQLVHIRSPQVNKRIQMYNAVEDVLATKGTEKVRLGTEKREARQIQGHGSADAVALQGRMSLLNVGIESLREISAKLRHELRDTRFKATMAADGERYFYPEAEWPDSLTHDARTWRLCVRAGGIDPQHMTMRGGGAVVGYIPAGVPSLSVPRFEMHQLITLFPMAVIISLLGFMEAISIAKAMAARTGQQLDPNQELIGQGLANIVGSVGQSYPVSGSFSRSAVNLQAGAVSGLSNVFSSGIVLLTLLFFTPLLYHLPQAVLAAIIMMAVIGLIRTRGILHAWRVHWYDGAVSIITFVSTLAFAPHLDRGIMIGVGLSIVIHLVRDMKPRIALLAKHPDGTFRNRSVFRLAQCRHIAVIRYQGSLIFSNVSYLEEQMLERVAAMRDLRHILVVGNGINELDVSGEEKLSEMVERLREAGYEISFSGLNDLVLNVMRRTGLYNRIGEDHLYRNATRAISDIWQKEHADSDEDPCPLITPVYEKETAPSRRSLLHIRAPWKSGTAPEPYKGPDTGEE
jgi:MFS superfamily sulfate permease-like transporter